MPNQNNNKNSIKPENKIKDVLNGDKQKNALDFIEFLQANEFMLKERDENGNGWNATYDGILTNCIYFDVAGFEFIINFCTLDFNGDGFIDDDLKNFTWAHTVICPQGCGSSEICEKSQKHIKIFGKDYENICISPLQFLNPDADDLPYIKKLILMIKQNIDDNVSN